MKSKLFPLTSKYDEKWILENSLLQNSLFYTESLCRIMDLKENMKVLDLGCGKAISSIFLAKEFGAQVFAVDREVSPSDNYNRILEMNVTEKVLPLKADARRLPFPVNYFDRIISIDSFSYYGTDDWFIPYLSQFIKPGGLIGIAEWCCGKEFKSISDVPDFLKKCYQQAGFHSIHSLEWWKNHFEKVGLFEIKTVDILPENEFLMADFIEKFQNLESEKLIVDALKNDRLKMISAFMLAARRTTITGYLDDFEDRQIL